MSSIISSPAETSGYPTLSAELFTAPIESGYEQLEWAMESLGAQFGIVIRDIDRFALMDDDPDCSAWLDEIISVLSTIELYIDPTVGLDLSLDSESLEELSETMLEESDWLLEHSEYVTERFGDYRLGVRLQALSAACFEVARCVPLDATQADLRSGRKEESGRPLDDLPTAA